MEGSAEQHFLEVGGNLLGIWCPLKGEGTGNEVGEGKKGGICKGRKEREIQRRCKKSRQVRGAGREEESSVKVILPCFWFDH
jgi:hypothetical protein